MTADLFAVELTAGAESDLEAIHAYMLQHRGQDDADALLDRFLETIQSLERYPIRGSIPKELDALGIRDFRQMLLQHFRVFYRVIERSVYVWLIADGRREMQALLERRLLRHRPG